MAWGGPRRVRNGAGRGGDHGSRRLHEIPGGGAWRGRLPIARLLRRYAICRSGPALLYAHAKGRIWSEATIARLSDTEFLLCGPTLAVERDFDWLSAQLPPSGVTLSKGYDRDAALLLMGPRSREVLAALTASELSATAAPWMSVAEIDVAGCAATALRVSYVGELGWELHVASRDLARLYDALWQAGDPMGICNFGSHALNAMRIEKGYHGWGRISVRSILCSTRASRALPI